MFRYQNHRFYCSCFSYQIPDRFFIDTNPDEDTDDYMQLVSPDESFSVDIRLEQNCKRSNNELASIIHDMTATIEYPIAPIELNGLHGHHATYRTNQSQYYEARFDLPDNQSLCLLIVTGSDILSIDTTAVVAAIAPRFERE